MSETDPKLARIEAELRELPPAVREAFLRRQYQHALVNLGPEAVRDAADGLTGMVDDKTTGTVWEALGDRVEGAIQRFRNSRGAHWVGKVGILVLIAVIGITFLRLWAS